MPGQDHTKYMRAGQGEKPETGRIEQHEVKRKLIHLSSSSIPLALLILPHRVGIAIVAAGLILAITVDIMRLRIPAVQRFFARVFGAALRPHESNELTGSTFMCISMLVCIVLFPMQIAIAALFFLTLGDTAAALVGQKWGRTVLLPGKTLEGTSACLFACTIVVVVMPGVPLIAGLAGALTATTVELFGTETIDDNFGIPVLSAVVMWIVASTVI
jgi:dolichol kinase